MSAAWPSDEAVRGAERRSALPEEPYLNPKWAEPIRIHFDKVSVEFETAAGPMRVIDDVSFEVSNGEFVSIIGPSGCGKTTLMNIVGGFVKPTKGPRPARRPAGRGARPRPRRDLPGVRRLPVAHGAPEHRVRAEARSEPPAGEPNAPRSRTATWA